MAMKENEFIQERTGMKSELQNRDTYEKVADNIRSDLGSNEAQKASQKASSFTLTNGSRLVQVML